MTASVQKDKKHWQTLGFQTESEEKKTSTAFLDNSSASEGRTRRFVFSVFLRMLISRVAHWFPFALN